METKRYTYTRKLRLVESRDYQRVFRHPHKVLTRGVTVFVRNNRQDHPRLGIVLPRKRVKTAVQRNRIKRIVKEGFRLHQYEFCGLDIVIMANDKTARLARDELQRCLLDLWKELAEFVVPVSSA